MKAILVKQSKEDNREPMCKKTVLSQVNMRLPDRYEEELVNDSDGSESSVIWPVLSKPSVRSTILINKSDSEENDSIKDENCITRDKEHNGTCILS